jgi:hypothetical protein
MVLSSKYDPPMTLAEYCPKPLMVYISSVGCQHTRRYTHVLKLWRGIGETLRRQVHDQLEAHNESKTKKKGSLRNHVGGHVRGKRDDGGFY